MRRNVLIQSCSALWVAAAVVLCATPGAADMDLLLLRQDWAPNTLYDPTCTNGGCGNKLDYGAFTVRDLVPSKVNTEGLVGCSGPAFDATQITTDVRSELQCVLSETEGAWEAAWNEDGRCSGMNVSQYFTFLSASYNLFNANGPLGGDTRISLLPVDRNQLVDVLRAAWGVKPWVACNPSSKALLYVTLCLDPGAAAAGVVLPIDCPWDCSGNVPGGAECSGDLRLDRGPKPPASCSAYYPAALEGAYFADPAFDVNLITAAGGGAAINGTMEGSNTVDDGSTATLGGQLTQQPQPVPEAGPGGAAASPAPLRTPQSPGSPSENVPGGTPAPSAPTSWSGLAKGPASLNPGSATVGNGSEFLKAMAKGVGDIALAGDIAFTPGDFHFQEYTLPINVSGAMRVRAANPAAPVVLDWSNVSGLINIYEDSMLVLEGVLSENVGNAQEAIAERTVRIQVAGSPIWPTVTGASGHRVLFLDCYLVVPEPQLFQGASTVLANASQPAEDSKGGVSVFYGNLTVVAPCLPTVDLTQLQGLGMASSYTVGRALYSLVNTTADTAVASPPTAPPSPPPDTGSSGLSTGAIGGIAAGAVVATCTTLMACVVWRQCSGAQQVCARVPGSKVGPKGVPPPGGGDSPKSSSFGGKDVVPPVPAGLLAAEVVVVHVGGDNASSQHAATVSADSGGSGGGNSKPGFARQVSGVSGASGSTPGTAHSVLPGGKNPFHSITTHDPQGDDLFLSYIHTKLTNPPVSVGSPTGATLQRATTAFGRESLLAPSMRRAALSSSESAHLWDVPFDQLLLQGKIGEGAFGRVYRGEWHATPVAIKVLLAHAQLQDTGSIEEALVKPSPVLARLQEEADLMFSLRHPNCVQLMGTCLAPPCLITEYCSHGSLADCLREARQQPEAAATLPWHRRLAMALDAAKGMLYLHSYQPPIVHRDLKSPNLLVDKDWNVKVADFNLSKILGEDHSASQEVTNPRWLAPEVLQGEQATPPSDVFGFGVVLWEMLTFHLPWGQIPEAANPWQLARMVLGGARLAVPPPDLLPGPDALPPELLHAYLQLMEGCWEANPVQRPTFADIAAELRDILQQLPLPTD